ncbi:MAG: hypothetical protein MUQ10_15965 [Anaerolineae bacterium]|nr:hypothetical protein [Anaerolineae bacterium]
MESKETRSEWLVSIGQVLAWLITAAGATLAALFVRGATKDFLVWNGDRRLQSFREAGEVGRALRISTRVKAADFIIIFLLTCLGVWAAVEIDFYFRKGRPEGLLLKRFLTVAGIEIGIIIGTVLLRILLQGGV